MNRNLIVLAGGVGLALVGFGADVAPFGSVVGWWRFREYLDFPSKYYPADIGLRNARLNFRQVEGDHLMECAIYNELVARGANVDVGVIEVQESVDGKRVKMGGGGDG